MKYIIYGLIHKYLKKLLRRNITNDSYKMVNISYDNYLKNKIELIKGIDEGNYINNLTDSSNGINLKDFYPIENIVPKGSFSFLKETYVKKNKIILKKMGVSIENCESIWLEFIKNSKISSEYKYGDLHYAGFIWEVNEWCLPSWIWTNAAIVKMYCTLNKIKEAKELANNIIQYQEQCGGWIVRNDYDNFGATPVLAPNDSAYLANNCYVEIYLKTKEEKYLNVALKCADWIIKTAREDGLVFVGYDTKRNMWLKDYNIVDIGFTAGLFSRLYIITKKSDYKDFLERFLSKYIELYYIKDKNGFATSLDANDKTQGGMFGRGQAWALEGLIPAYEVFPNKELKSLIDNIIKMLIKKQTKSGGWPYNLSRKMMGIDCKATSVIACSLIEWYFINGEDENLKKASERALKWCLENTANEGKQKGGIFSYTIEGAIVHHLYTNTAFVYSNAYAIRLKEMLNRL